MKNDKKNSIDNLSKNANLNTAFLNQNLGEENKNFDPKKKNFNDGIKGMKKNVFPSADNDNYFNKYEQNNRNDLNDIEEDEIEFTKKRN